MRKTNSIAPLVLAIIGGILGIIGGMCTTLCAEVGDALGSDATLSLIGGYGSLAGAIIGLVFGCTAKSWEKGSAMLLFMGVVQTVFIVLLFVDGWPFASTILLDIAAMLFIIGGIVGVKSPANT